jgi:hypothetical protein
MHGGRVAARISLAVALVALPLIGLAVLAGSGSPSLPAAPRDSVLRLAPGQGSDAQAVRPGSDARPGSRTAPGPKASLLLAVLLGAAATSALAAGGSAPRVPVPAGGPGRLVTAAGRGPPSRFPR